MDQDFYNNYRKRKPDRNPGCLGWFFLIIAVIVLFCGLMDRLTVYGRTGSFTGNSRTVSTSAFTPYPRSTIPLATATPAPKSNTVSAAAVGGIMNQIQRSVTATPKAKVTYILNKNTKVFHIPSCRHVGKMNPRNQIEFTGTRQQAIEKGYHPCGSCKP